MAKPSPARKDFLTLVVCSVLSYSATRVQPFWSSVALLLLLLSHFSRVRLCTTPETAANQAPLSLGFFRQEYWSGLPFPSPMHACMHAKSLQSCLTLWDPTDSSPLGSSVHRILQARILEWVAISFSSSSPQQINLARVFWRPFTGGTWEGALGSPAVRLQTQAVKWDRENLPGRLWQNQASLDPDLKRWVWGHWAGQHDPDPGWRGRAEEGLPAHSSAWPQHSSASTPSLAVTAAPGPTLSWRSVSLRLKEETEQALSWKQDSILGWTVSFLHNIYGNEVPTGKPGPPEGRTPGLSIA